MVARQSRSPGRGCSRCNRNVRDHDGQDDFRPSPPGHSFRRNPRSSRWAIDVTVVNPNGQTFLLSQGYEYAPQESFDFNGEWTGWTWDGSDVAVLFTIKNNVLVTASCMGTDGGTRTVALSTPVRNGEFSSGRYEGFVLSGRITSRFQALGQITAPCSSTHPIG